MLINLYVCLFVPNTIIYVESMSEYFNDVWPEIKMRIKIDECIYVPCVCPCMHVYVCICLSVCIIQVYDVNVDLHPVGLDQILYGAGRDITQLIKSYHPFSA